MHSSGGNCRAILVGGAAARPAKPRVDANGDPLQDGSVARLGSVRFQRRGHVRACAVSPDGATVAVEAADHEGVSVRHLPTRAEHCSLPVKQPGFAFTPDGKALITFDEGSRGTVWNAGTGKKVRDLEGALANEDFLIAGVSEDDGTVAVLDGGWHSAVAVRDAATRKRAGGPRDEKTPPDEDDPGRVALNQVWALP